MEDKVSLLIFQHYETQVAVYTDTLATSPDGKALAFCDKSFLVPHIGIVMATTGILQLAEIWYSRLNGPIFADDIDALDEYVTKNLQIIWDCLKKHSGGGIEITGTIYHFGWSAKHQQYVRYIYRSDKNFASEHYKEKGIGVKPIPNDKDAQLPEGIEGVTEFAEQIRMEQLAKPHNQRLYIGGELNMILMLNDSGNPITYQAKVHRFTNYDADREAIMARSPEDRLKNFPQISDPFTK
jgi:hypothetical protein